MKEKILEWCRTLATSQGFYGRLLKEFEEHPEKLEKVAKNDFKDVVDFVMFIES
jgi:hypothetical protein